jgi:hypothetical protein
MAIKIIKERCNLTEVELFLPLKDNTAEDLKK